MINNAPTLLSFLRIFCVLLIAAASVVGPYWLFIFIIFLIGSATDFFDGWIARRYNLCSEFGAWIDHLSDKLLVCTALIILCSHLRHSWLELCTILLVNRELLALGLRSYPGLNPTEQTTIKVHVSGKIKTALQFVALLCLFAAQLSGLAHGKMLLERSGLVLLSIAVVFAYLSLSVYGRQLRSHCEQIRR